MVGVVALFALVAAWGPAHEVVTGLTKRITPVMFRHPFAGAFVFMAFTILSPMLMLVSSVALIPIAVLVWGAPMSAAMLWVGWLVGGLLTYTLGRNFGRPAVKRWLPRKQIAKWEHLVPKDAPVSRAVLIQMTVPSDIAGYCFGIIAYPRRKFLLAMSIAEVPYALGAAFFGSAFVNRSTSILIGATIAGVLLIAWLMRGGWHRQAVDSHRATKAA